mmetsp:Transcript_19740/g.63483  ORF Transcript_19740/g.63483 Transcript_19740/m.63483 type:complete len:400 (+) Transcript_19740:258-1457(+)
MLKASGGSRKGGPSLGVRMVRWSLVVVGFAVCSMPPMCNVIYDLYSNVWPPAMAGKILGLAKGLEHFEVAKAAVELGVFDYLEQGPASVSRVASGIRASERGTRVLLEYLKTLSLVRSRCRRGGGGLCEYSLAPAAKLFLTESAGSMNMGGFLAKILGNEDKQSKLAKAKEAVVKGGAPEHAVDGVRNNADYYRDFAIASWSMGYAPARKLAAWIPSVVRDDPKHVLDVACGSGVYGALMSQKFPKAKVTFMDQHVVIPTTKKILEDHGANGTRFSFTTGSAFDAPLPARKFDLVLVSNFIHLFEPKTAASLLLRFKTALTDDGIMLVNDLIRHDKATVSLFDDFAPVEFDFNMLTTTAKGQTYSIPELDDVLKNAGLKRVAVKRNFPFPFTFVAAKRI